MENHTNKQLVDREISVNPSTSLTCKINADGIIEYVNHAFTEMSGYDEYEIIGESMDVLRHPDMPNVIFDILKERFDRREPIKLINKVLAKDGRFFWLMSDFETKLNEAGEVIAHYSSSVAAPSFVVHKITSLYKILSKIESKSDNTEISKRYLIGFLEERNLSYNQFVEELCTDHSEFDKPVQSNQLDFNQRAQKTMNSMIEQEEEKHRLQPNNVNYNSNFDISNSYVNEMPNRIIKKEKKKKSLFMKVFGK